MIRTPCGKILSAIDHGTVWQLLYQINGDGLGVVNFDHRLFAHFYEGATGRDFIADYAFGRGREYVSSQLKDIRISVEGDAFDQTIGPEDD